MQDTQLESITCKLNLVGVSTVISPGIVCVVCVFVLLVMHTNNITSLVHPTKTLSIFGFLSLCTIVS